MYQPPIDYLQTKEPKNRYSLWLFIMILLETMRFAILYSHCASSSGCLPGLL